MIMKMKSEKDVTNEMPWVLRIHEIGCLSIKLFLVLFIPYGVSKKLKFDFGLFSAIKSECHKAGVLNLALRQNSSQSNSPYSGNYSAIFLHFFLLHMIYL